MHTFQALMLERKKGNSKDYSGGMLISAIAIR
jgi:hypothetical protein